jgi:hypothetical protein
MASKKNNNFPEVADEDLGFSNKGYVSELKATRKTSSARELQAELLNKFEPSAVIDAFEEAHGTKRRQPEGPKYNYKNLILEPCKLKDQQMLNELMNNGDKYVIKLYKDSFSARGDYKAFVIYGELIDKDAPVPVAKKEEPLVTTDED